MPATLEGTAAYAARSEGFSDGHFRRLGERIVSSIGLGSYLGAPDDQGDAAYRESARAAWRSGCNVVDTAINYRHQRSERALGQALREAIAAGEVRREEIVIATKGGYLPFDREVAPDPAGYLKKTYVDSGLCDAAELVARCHCLAPTYLRNQIDRSLANLGIDCIDLYYLHNPEQQLDEVPRPEFLRRMRAAFEALEDAASRGHITAYGTATWNGYRVPPTAKEHLSLEELVGLARQVAGDSHRFQVIQLPLNLAMTEALAALTQVVAGEPFSALGAAARLGVGVMTSASIMQGRLARLPEEISSRISGGSTDAQRALQFVRSAPGVDVALCGMSRAEHVAENLELARVPLMR